MQEKILKTVLFSTLLSVLSSGAYADTQTFDKPLLSPYVLQPGVYMGIAYTYARVQNAHVRDFELYNPVGDEVFATHTSRYGDGNGFNIKFGQLLTKHWGYELNLSQIYSQQDSIYSGLVNGPGPAPGTARIDTNTTTSIVEALGIYAATIGYNLDLYAKIGLGYEYQKQTSNVSGYVTFPGPQYANFDPTTEVQKRSGVGLATALEVRYHIMEHLALSFEVNNLAARENVVAGNVGLVANF